MVWLKPLASVGRAPHTAVAIMVRLDDDDDDMESLKDELGLFRRENDFDLD